MSTDYRSRASEESRACEAFVTISATEERMKVRGVRNCVRCTVVRRSHHSILSGCEGGVISSSRTIFIIAIFCLVGVATTLAGSPAETRERNPATLLTLVLHQDKEQSVADFKTQLEANGFQEAFPPQGVEIVSWTGVLGLGHVITLRLPTYLVPDVRQAVDACKWGKIEPRLYSSYDFEPFWQDMGGPTQEADDGYASGGARMLIAP
jgi:hypothetical protein